MMLSEFGFSVKYLKSYFYIEEVNIFSVIFFFIYLCLGKFGIGNV